MMHIARDDIHFDYDMLATKLAVATDDDSLFTSIVNAPFESRLGTALLFLGIIVLLQVDRQGHTINRVALSETEMARSTTDVSVIPFHDIKIPLDYYENIIAKAIASGEPSDTTDWKFLFNPVMEAEQARINQASAGISYSAVYPLQSRDGGAMIFSYYQYQHDIGLQQMDFMQQYSALVDTVLNKLN